MWNIEYEYISIEVDWLIKDATELNKYAKQGWRLVTIIQQIAYMPPYAIFERVKVS